MLKLTPCLMVYARYGRGWNCGVLKRWQALLHPQMRLHCIDVGVAVGAPGRWIEQAPYLAQCGVLANSPHTFRLASLPSRQQHAAVELFRGTMVAHSFIAYRDDRSHESQPISFAGDSWRDYILFDCHGRCAFGNVCLLVASRR